MTIHKISFRYFFFLGYCLCAGWGCNLEYIPPMPEDPKTLVADFDFTLTPTEFAPCSVDFTNKSVNAASYKWYSNDVLFDSVSKPQGLKYAQPGSYTVKLVVRDSSQKDSASRSQVITVKLNKFEKILSAYGVGKKVLATLDGEFIIAGNKLQAGSTSSTDGYIIKIKVEPNGNVVTSFNLTINMSNEDDINDLIPFANGGVGVIGTTLSKDGTNRDIFYARFSSETGVWLKDTTRIGSNAKHESALGAVVTSNPVGWFAVCGYSTAPLNGTQNAYLFNRDPTASFSNMDMPYTSSNVEIFNDLALNIDGGFVAVGKTKVANTSLGDVFFMRTNATGTKLTSKPFSTPLDLEEARAVIKTVAGKFFIVGISQLNGTMPADFWFALTDQDGAGTPSVFGDAALGEDARDIIELTSGNFMVAGSRGTSAALIKTNALGQSPIVKTYGTQAKFYSLCPTKDGGLLMVGSSGNSLYFIKTDIDGN